MDLSTMSHKLENGMYKNREDFRADFKLMIANAKLYNAPGSRPVQLADALDTMFDNQWTKMEKTLDTLRTQRQTVLHAQGSSEATSIDPPAPARGTKPPPPLVVENVKSHEPAPPAAQAAIKPFTLKLKAPRAETPSTDAFKPAQTDPPLKAPLKASGAAPSFADDSLGSNAPKVPKKGKSTAKAATDPAIGQLPSSKADGISKKTKEKTSQPPPSTSRSPSKVPGANEHPLDPRKGKALVKKMMDMPESVFFRRPVDPVADGCPT
jgi:transcription initiation factor TFIID subunit 2